MELELELELQLESLAGSLESLLDHVVSFFRCTPILGGALANITRMYERQAWPLARFGSILRRLGC